MDPVGVAVRNEADEGTAVGVRGLSVGSQIRPLPAVS